MDGLTLQYRDVVELVAPPRQIRTHSKQQISQIADSIREFGFTNPLLITHDSVVVAGNGRLAAARLLGMVKVPTVCLSELSDVQLRAYALADNKLALEAGWDQDILAIELEALSALDISIPLTGFSVAECDIIIETAKQSNPKARREDSLPAEPGPAVCRPGDIWELGRHRMVCEDVMNPEAMRRLLGAEKVDMVFTDPPYNVRIDGNVSGLGRVKHGEFAMASGEMSSADFTYFLMVAMGFVGSVCRDGAIAYVFMDWRHMKEMLEAGLVGFDELKNVCVWNKQNAGMGSFYRSKHELVFVYKRGTAPHINNFGLGGSGRYRTNVWDYHGMSSISGTRSEELAMHPTVKPVALVADAILDCSHRGHLILDCFAGSGTTLIAAEKTGRTARLVEIDPKFCDTIIARYEKYTGRSASLVSRVDQPVHATTPTTQGNTQNV